MSSGKEYQWIKVAESLIELGFGDAGSVEVDVNGKRVCLSLFKEQLFACAAKCPHAGAAMAGGYVDALGNVVCPLHRYKFNLQTGRNVSGEGYYLKTWPVDQRADGIYVGMEKSSFF